MACLFGHKWNGCKCSKCGKVQDIDHKWGLINNESKCFVCGKPRTCEHVWKGCKCTVCGIVRDEQHDFNGCKCSHCGKTRDEQHQWSNGRCVKCNKTCSHQWNYCICRICGLKRTHIDPKNSSWREDAHDLNYCTCRVCGKKAGACNYKQVPGQCMEKCTVCGATRENHEYEQIMGQCNVKCKNCGHENELAHKWKNVQNSPCKQKCSICALEKVQFGGPHQWEIVDGTCQVKCKVCGGIMGETANDSNWEHWFHHKIHKWDKMSGCQKKCSMCGISAYDHDYVATRTPTGDSELASEYKCRKCGHQGTGGGRAPDTIQIGKI